MTAIINGIQYIGGGTAPNELYQTKQVQSTVHKQLKNGVLAGPITYLAQSQLQEYSHCLR